MNYSPDDLRDAQHIVHTILEPFLTVIVAGLVVCARQEIRRDTYNEAAIDREIEHARKVATRLVKAVL